MTAIRIDVDDTRIRAALNRLLQASQDMTPAMKDIAEHLEGGLRGRFLSETDPDGKKWAALSETTQKRKAKSRRTGARILEESKRLKTQITSDHDAMSVVVGTNVAYAPTHQFGADRGEYGSFSLIARVIRGKYSRVNKAPRVFGAQADGTGGYSLIGRIVAGNYQAVNRRRPAPVQVPWGDIPARPFLGLSDTDEKNILDTINAFIEQQWR